MNQMELKCGNAHWHMLTILLCISHEPHKIMKAILEMHRLKDDKVGPPTRHSGAMIEEWKNSKDLDQKRWGLSSDECVKQAISNAEQELLVHHKQPDSEANSPMASGHRPESDTLEVLTDEATMHCPNPIGVSRKGQLNWDGLTHTLT